MAQDPHATAVWDRMSLSNGERARNRTCSDGCGLKPENGLAVQKCLRFVAAPSPALNWLDQMGSQAPTTHPITGKDHPHELPEGIRCYGSRPRHQRIAPVLSLAPAAAAPKSETGLPIEITKAVNGRWLQPDQVERLRSADNTAGKTFQGGLRRRGSLLRGLSSQVW